MAVAVSMAKYLGATKLAVPSAGNAGGALAAYAARAGLEAHIFMPRDTPRANIIECRELGAQVTLIDGLITDCGAEIAKRKRAEGWFDMSTLKEPYRVEGKKTLGYELAEQLDWHLPDVILYPTGGGTGLIGMWKAFDEMEALGWIGKKRPRMFSVQATGCAPIVRAFENGDSTAAEFPEAHTCASGLRVPKAIGDFLILKILRQSNGGAVAVDDEEMIRVTREVGSSEGLFVAPEGAACFAALKSLRFERQNCFRRTGGHFQHRIRNQIPRLLPGLDVCLPMSNKGKSREGCLERIDCARFHRTYFVAPHLKARADLVADFTCAGEALFTRAGERGRIWKTPVQSLGHASKDGTTLRTALVADRDHVGEQFARFENVEHGLRLILRNIDPDLAHRFDCQRIELPGSSPALCGSK